MRILVKLVVVILGTALGAQAAEIAVLRNGFTIRHERRQVLQDTTRLYISGNNFVDVATDQIASFEKDDTPDLKPAPDAATQSGPPASLLPEVVNKASDRHLIDADLIASVIRAESGENPRAVSPKGAQGLMQLMPETATKLGVTNAFDPAANVDGGTRYLRELLERYNYDLVKALAAYNAGPQRVEQYRGVPPYRETRAYVARIVKDFNRKKLAERKAATPPKQQKLATSRARVSKPTRAAPKAAAGSSP